MKACCKYLPLLGCVLRYIMWLTTDKLQKVVKKLKDLGLKRTDTVCSLLLNDKIVRRNRFVGGPLDNIIYKGHSKLMTKCIIARPHIAK